MRILFLSDNFPPESNAPATRTYEHAIRWVRAGHAVTIITCAPNFPDGKVYAGYANRWHQVEDLGGIRVVRVKSYMAANAGFVRRTLDYLSFMVTGGVAGLCEQRPDVVVATSPQFFCAVAGWLVAALRRRPFVFELRDLWPASIVAVGAMRRGLVIRVLEWIERFLYRRAAAIVAVTDAFRRDLVGRGIAADRIHVVCNGVDLARYEPRARDPELARRYGLEGRFVVGYLGTHGMAHALDKVLEAAARLRGQPGVTFFFAGSGAARADVERDVARQRLDNVRLIPPQPQSRMPALWSLCDLTVVPLRNAPVFSTVIPSKVFEAMAMGVPIVMSLPDGEATAVVREAGAGVCVPPEDPAALAAAIRELAGDPARVEAMGAAARAAAPRFSRDASAARMLAVLRDVVEAGMGIRRTPHRDDRRH